VYAGVGTTLGGMYRIFGNKSGWNNTGDDNSLETWAQIVAAGYALYPDKDPEEVLNLRVNSDDLILVQKHGSFYDMCMWLRQYGAYIESDNWTPRPLRECVYLSHTIKMRFVRGFGDFLVAAGNLPKLLSSLNWVKKSNKLTEAESCVAHLLGIRMCLFPWKDYFEEVDELLGKYLSTQIITTFISNCLPARLNEIQLARLHTRAECFDFFALCKSLPSDLINYWNEYQVVEIRGRLINNV